MPFARAVDGLKLYAKGVERPALIGIGKISRQLAADHALDRLDHFIEPLAHIGVVGIVNRGRHAEFGGDLRKHGIGQHLAVGEHAVEVKDDRAMVSAQLPGVHG